MYAKVLAAKRNVLFTQASEWHVQRMTRSTRSKPLSVLLKLNLCRWLCPVAVVELVHDPEAELLPLDGPLAQAPRLEALADGREADIAVPVGGGLVLEGGPADRVLGEGAQPGEAEAVPALHGLPEVVGAAGGVLTEHGRVVVAEGTGDAAGEQGGQRVRGDGAAEAQDLVGDGAALDEDALLLDQVDQQRVLVQAEAVPDAPRPQQHRVEQVVVRLRPRAQALARVEEEGQDDALLRALPQEPHDLRQQVAVRAAQVFLADQVVPRDQCRVRQLGRDAVVHVLHDGARVTGADAGPDGAQAPETRTFLAGLELAHLLVQHVHHRRVVPLGRLAVLPVVVQPPREAQLRVVDAVGLERRHEPLQEAPVDGLVVDYAVDDAEA